MFFSSSFSCPFQDRLKVDGSKTGRSRISGRSFVSELTAGDCRVFCIHLNGHSTKIGLGRRDPVAKSGVQILDAPKNHIRRSKNIKVDGDRTLIARIYKCAYPDLSEIMPFQQYLARNHEKKSIQFLIICMQIRHKICFSSSFLTNQRLIWR